MRIGIVMDYCLREKKYFINSAYVEKIVQAGAFPILLPYTQNISQVAASIDGVVLAGGGDPDPIHFGAEPSPLCGPINPIRDSYELEIAIRCLAENIPLLGICRGAQIMNIAGGGDIYQDISDIITIQHQQQAPRWHPTHKVQIAPKSLLFRVLKADQVRVNSFHHQSIRKLAPGFIVSGMATDGIVEAIEGAQDFALGVQWHPEELDSCQQLFQALVAAARKKDS